MHPIMRKVLQSTILVCGNCSQVFKAHKQVCLTQKLCPLCMDAIQDRPTQVVNRKMIARYCAVQIESMPGKWQEFQATRRDLPCWKIDVSGKELAVNGEKWFGRVVIYADYPFEAGINVDLRHMEVTKKTKVATGRKIDPVRGEVQYVNRYHISSNVVDGEIIEEKSMYLFLEVSPAYSNRRLRWIDENQHDNEVWLGSISAGDKRMILAYDSGEAKNERKQFALPQRLPAALLEMEAEDA